MKVQSRTPNARGARYRPRSTTEEVLRLIRGERAQLVQVLPQPEYEEEHLPGQSPFRDVRHRRRHHPCRTRSGGVLSGRHGHGRGADGVELLISRQGARRAPQPSPFSTATFAVFMYTREEDALARACQDATTTVPSGYARASVSGGSPVHSNPWREAVRLGQKSALLPRLAHLSRDLERARRAVVSPGRRRGDRALPGRTPRPTRGARDRGEGASSQARARILKLRVHRLAAAVSRSARSASGAKGRPVPPLCLRASSGARGTGMCSRTYCHWRRSPR